MAPPLVASGERRSFVTGFAKQGVGSSGRMAQGAEGWGK